MARRDVLLADFERSGFRNRSHTGTERLLHAYEAFGLDHMVCLNGMFAAAIHNWREPYHDESRRRTLAVRGLAQAQRLDWQTTIRCITRLPD